MVHALYLALRLFISGYFAPSLIHAGDSQAETPWTSCERDRLPHSEDHSGEHSGGGSPAQTAHTVATPLTFNKRGNGQQLPPDNARDDDEREQPMTFTVSQVNAWRAELAAMPAPDPTTRAVGKRAALEMMAKELQALCRRGYTTAELLELLATKGLHTHEETLRAVLRTARPSGPRATTRPRPSQSPTDSSSSAAGQVGQQEDRRADSNGTVTPTAEEPPPGQHQTQAQAAGPPGQALNPGDPVPLRTTHGTTGDCPFLWAAVIGVAPGAVLGFLRGSASPRRKLVVSSGRDRPGDSVPGR